MVSIHAPREGCDSEGIEIKSITNVSIHAPREGCDIHSLDQQPLQPGFQFTHPGRGATYVVLYEYLDHRPFQFTHPGRGATTITRTILGCVLGFNSRTPGGVRQHHVADGVHCVVVSIHAPREGCDYPWYG